MKINLLRKKKINLEIYFHAQTHQLDITDKFINFITRLVIVFFITLGNSFSAQALIS